VLEQRIGRIYRLGQNNPIDVYNLVSEYGIESRIADTVGAKQALFSELFDGTSDEIRFDAAASFLTRVERIVDPGPLPVAPRASARRPIRAIENDDADEAADAEALLAEAAVADEVPAVEEPRLLSQAGETAIERSHHESNGDRKSSSVSPSSTAALFASLRVERTESGGVRIEAPREAAGTLVALFDGMAKLLAEAQAS
jgi:hypothetical protein